MINIKTFLLILAFVAIAGCTTMKPVYLNQDDNPPARAISAGDRLRLVSRSGEEYLVTVSSVNDTTIFSQDSSFDITDLASIERSELSVSGKVGLVVIGILIIKVIDELIQELLIKPNVKF